MGRRELAVILLGLAVVYSWSGFEPADPATWWMEVAPILALLPVVLLLDRRVGLTALTLRLLAFEAVLVAVGAHYTYSHVPLGFWVSDLLGCERNHYDRFGHFMQGVVPALLLRELLLRSSPLVRGKWLFVIVSSMCLALSAIYEFLEWGAAVIFADGATEFLGTQGDPWDAQWDMLLALVGSVLAQVFLRGIHDTQLSGLMSRRARGAATF